VIFFFWPCSAAVFLRSHFSLIDFHFCLSSLAQQGFVFPICSICVVSTRKTRRSCHRFSLQPGLHLVLDLFVFRADWVLFFSLSAACVHLLALIQFLLLVSTIGSLHPAHTPRAAFSRSACQLASPVEPFLQRRSYWIFLLGPVFVAAFGDWSARRISSLI
jgi:hypothetical protein